jgi:hypothetical protein
MPDLPLISDSLTALVERQRRDREAMSINRPRPINYVRPAYGTDAYRADYRVGWITWDDWEADERTSTERRARANASYGTHAAAPVRWGRGGPQDTRQYANPMATTAARDDRLTPQAKALLQVIRARCGKGDQMQTTKFTLASYMSRHVRSVQRYLAELQRFGYINARTRCGPSGLFTGLLIQITEKVTPFFAKGQALADWLTQFVDRKQPKFPQFHAFSEETTLSPKNQYKKIILISNQNGHAFGVT